MTLGQLFLVIWARKWAVVGMVILGIAVAIAISFIFSPRYRAETEVVVDFKSMDPVSGMMVLPQATPGYLTTQFDIIQSHRVALKVVKKLKLADNPFAKEEWRQTTGGRGNIEDWLADLLTEKLDVVPTRDSSVISIRYTSQDPQFAALIADSFAKSYIETNLELRVEPARDSATWFDEQLKALRTNLETTQAKLSAYQREHGFSAIDERADVESAKLSELSAQMIAAQAAASDAVTRLNQLNDFVKRGADPRNMPDILANPLVQSMKAQLSQSEARLEMLSSQLGANHPDLQRLRADIATQRQNIRDEIGNVAAGIRNTQRIAERREAELRQAANAQKTRMLNLNKGRDEMSVLIKEVDSAQRALDAANSRFTQENLQSRSSQANVMLLSLAVPPLSPRFPKLMLNVPIGILVGLFFGINLALLREMIDRRVRSAKDLTDAIEGPVLAVLERTSERLKGRHKQLLSRRKSVRRPQAA
jgi:chain length determinant protein EpsF